MSVFFTNLIALALILIPAHEAFAFKRHSHSSLPAAAPTSTNSHFCKCDTEGDRFMLVRVDISGGQKHETKVRDYLRGTHTLAQCEDGIVNHPSCK